MAVSVQETVFNHVGNSVTVDFAYGCQILAASDLVVFIDDVETTAGFTVNGVGVDAGGSVTFDVAPADGKKIRLERVIKLERKTNYQQSGDFLSRVVNPDFDRVWMALQRVNYFLGVAVGGVARVLRLGDSDTNGIGAYRAQNNRIQDLADPVNDQDATSKRWVLTQLAGFLVDGAGQFVMQLLSMVTGASLIGWIQSGVGTVKRWVQDKLRESVSFDDFEGAGANDNAKVLAALASGHKQINGYGKTYVVTVPLDIPPGVCLNNVTFDLTALTNQVGFTTRVGSKFTGVRVLYSPTFSGVGWYFTTIDNQSSTSSKNQDTNVYLQRDVIVEKQMPDPSGDAWDWYTTAAGLAIKWEGLDNPDPILTSGFWGGLLDNVIIKGVWLQAGLLTDDGTGWITSSTWRRVTIDGPRRGIQIKSLAVGTPKTGNLTIDDVHMQSWRWTRAGQADVITEWMLDADSTQYCHFRNFQPQDFDGAHGITNYIRFGVTSRRNYFHSVYITTDAAIQNLGFGNWWDSLFGRSFPNIFQSTHKRTLDWYEEDSFVPSFEATGLVIGYAHQQGYFTRIGNRVHFNLHLEVNSLSGAPSGPLKIIGLPYVSSNEPENFCPVAVGFANLINSAAGYTQFGGYIGPQFVSIILQYYGDNVPAAAVQASDIVVGTRIMVSGSYKV